MKVKILIRLTLPPTTPPNYIINLCGTATSGFIESIKITGDRLEVIGEGIDAVMLTKMLRKELPAADLLYMISEPMPPPP
ncbi:hypothetical protein M569_15801 [Genlisea aurea]|uniref:HMA domain-containing protein n=1 Tax=Genlisea aurea TaxID=192259 RepID=S8BWM9_9LAMI|nr:hypothetical protein M569_15801 [Genlisea aurea]